MMQLFTMNDPTVIDINKKMSTLGEALETNNLTLNTVNCPNNENTLSSANNTVKNETINGMNQASLNINAILKINGPEVDAKTENDQVVKEKKIEPNGQTNGYSVPNVDCKISADDMNTSEKNLKEKEDVIFTNTIEVAEPDQTRNIVDESSSEIPALEETLETGKNTPTNIDILLGDNVTTSKISAFSPNSDADETQINISSQLEQLENDASIEDEVTPNSLITTEIKKEITEETTPGDISLNQIEENEDDSLLKKGANDELVTSKKEQIVLPCRDSSIINAKNNGISEVSMENESTVDEVFDDIPVLSDNISHNVDHVISDKPSTEEESNLPPKELSKKQTMDIDHEQIDLSSQDVLKPETQTNGISEDTTENESMVDEIFDDAVISDKISYKVEVFIDKPSVEEASNLPLKEFSKETNQKETMDIDEEQIDPPCEDGLKSDPENNRISKISSENESIVDEVLGDAPVISGDISHKLDHVIIDKPSLEKASNEQISIEPNQKEIDDIYDEQIDTPSRDEFKPNTQSIGISEVTSENESTLDKKNYEAHIISDSMEDDQDIIDKVNLEEASNLPIGCLPFGDSSQSQTIDIDATKDINNDIILDENDQMLKSQVMDVDDTVVCTSQKQPKAAKIISDEHDSTKNDIEDKNSPEKEPISLSKETTEAYSQIPSKDIYLNQNDNVVINIDDAKETSSEESDSPTAVNTNGINIDTKSDEALSANLEAVEVKQKQKVNVDMDIDDIEELSTVVSTVGSDIDTKKISIATESNEEVPTEQDPVVCLSDKIETNVKKRNLMNSKVKDKESSDVISIDESEINASQDKPVISICSVAPEENPSPIISEKKLPVVCKLSNTMDILSDDEDEPSEKSIDTNEKVDEEPKKVSEENKCINLDDDDDIMFIEDTNSQEQNQEHNEAQPKLAVDNTIYKTNLDSENENSTEKSEEEVPDIIEAGKKL